MLIQTDKRVPALRLCVVVASLVPFDTGDQVRAQARDHPHRGAKGVPCGDRARRHPHRAGGLASRSLQEDGHPLLHHEGQGESEGGLIAT